MIWMAAVCVGRLPGLQWRKESFALQRSEAARDSSQWIVLNVVHNTYCPGQFNPVTNDDRPCWGFWSSTSRRFNSANQTRAGQEPLWLYPYAWLLFGWSARWFVQTRIEYTYLRSPRLKKTILNTPSNPIELYYSCGIYSANLIFCGLLISYYRRSSLIN
jgi:hypothetical protein